MDHIGNTKIIHLGSANRTFFQGLALRFPGGWVLQSPETTDMGDPPVDDAGKTIEIVDIDHDRYAGQGGRNRRADILEAGIPVARLIILAMGEEPRAEYDELVDYLEMPLAPWRVMQTLHRLSATLAARQELALLRDELSLQTRELSELNQIGIALSAERDFNKLLDLILTKAREITTADAGSLYLVETDPDVPPDTDNFWADKRLRFKLTQNSSLSMSFQEFVMPVIKTSMAGYTAISGQPLNIVDAYAIPEDSNYSHNRSFDQRTGYQTRSMLNIPMQSHHGEAIGVLQLINRKRHWATRLENPDQFDREVIPFDAGCETLASSLAGQAAVSIDNMRLYEEIKHLFEGFIYASVHAIEQRDPTTSGHSERVAVLTVGLAEVVDRVDQGAYREAKFTAEDLQQIKYASLLHDFGKIGVRERVLVKEKKLYPEQLEAIKFRFEFIKKALEANYSHRKIRSLLERNREEALGRFTHWDMEFEDTLKEMDTFLEVILQANEPRILAETGWQRLMDISRLAINADGREWPYLTPQEAHLLSIPKGSLSEKERKEIESHVTHSFNFLNRIPWSSNLRNVPEWAYGHHEKLDGTGYPRGLNAPQIPLPSKIMTISDIFDALTAKDRPYKSAVSVDRALSILDAEVREGKIDPELFRLFVQAEVYKQVF
ncbi:MAG: GAF domain-containing protein [Deltaproteobacteria bacterium]|nr:GAF domain-containing protein [Deltaproteobacteria bacterium]